MPEIIDKHWRDLIISEFSKLDIVRKGFKDLAADAGQKTFMNAIVVSRGEDLLHLARDLNHNRCQWQ